MDGLVTADHVWITVGFIGQALFASRFLQLVKSKMEGKNVTPVAFYISASAGD